MGMAAYDSYDAQSLLRLSSSMDQLTFDAWRERDKRFCVSSPVVDDWIPAAVELKDAVRPRPGYAIDPDKDEYVPPAVEGIKELLAMWPGGPRCEASIGCCGCSPGVVLRDWESPNPLSKQNRSPDEQP